MREILFRGKDEHTAEWVYGHFYTTPYVGKDGKKFDYHFISNPNAYGSNLVIPNSIGEFTGLLDRNGKRIFEGDIVEHHVQGNILVNRGVVNWDARNGRWAHQLNTMNPCFYMHNPEAVEVIGNIHDNPELLEVDE